MDLTDENGKVIAQANGESHGNDIYLNVNAKAEQNLGYVFMHEMTHQIKNFAPEEYKKLENLVRDRWFRKDYEGMQQAVRDKIALYDKLAHQKLTEEEALEEIIADAMAEAIDDRNFAKEVCEQDIDLGHAILSSIKSALRSIRQIFRGSKYKNESFHNGLLSYLDILDEAEKTWIDALAVARQNKADQAIEQWDEDARGKKRLSIHLLSDGTKVVRMDGNIFVDENGDELPANEAYRRLIGKKVTTDDGDEITFIKALPGNMNMYEELFKRLPKNEGFDDVSEVKRINKEINKNIIEITQASENVRPNIPDHDDKHKKKNSCF